jgi:hypothetical protein
MKRQPRNIIAAYPGTLRRQIAVWLADGVSGVDVRRRLEKLGVAPLPKNSSVAAYRSSAEYKRIYERQLGMAADISAAETDWKIAEAAGANGYAAAAVFETLRDLRGQYAEAADVAEKVALASAINSISRTLGSSETEKLKEADRAWKRQAAEAADQHAAELAARDAQITQLQEEIAHLEAATEEQLAKLSSGRQITPEVIAQIRRIYGIKPADTAPKPEAPKPA